MPNAPAFLHAERFTTATALISVGISKLEATADHGIVVVQHQAVEVQHTFGVANNLEAVIVEDFITVIDLAAIFKVHHVGHSRATALTNPDSQAKVFPLFIA